MAHATSAVNLACCICGEEFQVESGPGRYPRYCSDRCRRSRHRQEARPYEPVLRELTCSACGNPFTQTGPGKTRHQCYGCNRRHRQAPSPRPCGTCAKWFTPSPHGPNSTFCSPRCSAWWNDNGHEPYRPGRRTSCEVCNRPFRARRGRWGWSTTCSPKCSKKRNVQRAKANRPPNRECEHCGKAFYAVEAPSLIGGGRGRFCGQACFSDARRKPKPPPRWEGFGSKRRYEAHLKAERSAKGTCGTHPLVAGQCRWCGIHYVAKRTGGKWPNGYCSLRCGQRMARHNRNARQRQGPPGVALLPTPITPVARATVMQRDGWVCQLCGEPTRPDKADTLGTRHPHPLAPTIDHIIPLSKGGLHTMGNVQCAHYRCNGRKRDQIPA